VIRSGIAPGAGSRPRPRDPVLHGDGAPAGDRGATGRAGSILVAERQQELAGGFQVGFVDDGKGSRLHGSVGSIRQREVKRARDTASLGVDTKQPADGTDRTRAMASGTVEDVQQVLGRKGWLRRRFVRFGAFSVCGTEDAWSSRRRVG
jgi:hypothetical protein